LRFKCSAASKRRKGVVLRRRFSRAPGQIRAQRYGFADCWTAMDRVIRQRSRQDQSITVASLPKPSAKPLTLAVRILLTQPIPVSFPFTRKSKGELHVGQRVPRSNVAVRKYGSERSRLFAGFLPFEQPGRVPGEFENPRSCSRAVVARWRLFFIVLRADWSIPSKRPVPQRQSRITGQPAHVSATRQGSFGAGRPCGLVVSLHVA
jgi:hypothetical protein